MSIQETGQNQAEKLLWLRSEIEKGLEDLREGRIEDGPTAMAKIRQNLLDLKTRKEAENEDRSSSA